MVKTLQQTELEKGINFLKLIMQGASIGELAHKFSMDYVEVRRILHSNPEYVQYQKKMRNAKCAALKQNRVEVAQKSY